MVAETAEIASTSDYFRNKMAATGALQGRLRHATTTSDQNSVTTHVRRRVTCAAAALSFASCVGRTFSCPA
jgi:hypothetical protein